MGHQNSSMLVSGRVYEDKKIHPNGEPNASIKYKYHLLAMDFLMIYNKLKQQFIYVGLWTFGCSFDQIFNN